MKIQDCINLAEAKLQGLNNDMATAVATGNEDEIPRIQSEVDETETTLGLLRGLA